MLLSWLFVSYFWIYAFFHRVVLSGSELNGANLIWGWRQRQTRRIIARKNCESYFTFRQLSKKRDDSTINSWLNKIEPNLLAHNWVQKGVSFNYTSPLITAHFYFKKVCESYVSPVMFCKWCRGATWIGIGRWLSNAVFLAVLCCAITLP